MKRALILGERMPGDFVDENFETRASLFDETGIKDAVVVSERQQPVQRFSGQRRYNNLNRNICTVDTPEL